MKCENILYNIIIKLKYMFSIKSEQVVKAEKKIIENIHFIVEPIL